MTIASPDLGSDDRTDTATPKAILASRIRWILHLLGGNVGVAVIMFGSISLAARSLGPRDFGAFVLVLAIGRVCERLLRFESWQPLVRFVAVEESSGNKEDIARLYAYGLILDIAAALAAAFVATLAGLLIGDWFGLASDQTWLVAVYAIAIACNIRGMPSAALRMAGRFLVLAYIQSVSGLLRLAGAFILLWLEGGVFEFVLLWTIVQIFDALVFNIASFRSLHAQNVPSLFAVSWRGLSQRFPGFLGFAFSTNLSSTLRSLTHEADTLLVGLFAGPGPAGLYFLARRIAKVAQQVGDLVQMVAYPDLARFWTKPDARDFGRIVFWIQLLFGCFAIAAFLGTWAIGKPLLVLAFGAEFAGAHALLLAQLVAVALILHAAPSRSALLAMNRPRFVLFVAVISTILFFAIAVYALPRFGALGANFAHIAFGACTALLLDVAAWKGIRSRKRSEDP